jgi:hypothetical protein
MNNKQTILIGGVTGNLGGGAAVALVQNGPNISPGGHELMFAAELVRLKNIKSQV